jgi:hypothetical protein
MMGMRQLRHGAVLIAFIGLCMTLSSCSGEARPSQESPAPALFVMAVKPTPCPTNERATACLDVTISNIGDMTGDGTCQLLGTTQGSTQEGKKIRVSGLSAHAVQTRVEQWTGPRQDFYRGICEPGPGM